MLTLLRQTKVRKYRLENLLLPETLVFLCIPAPRVKDILRLLRLGASPNGCLAGLSPKILRRIEGALLNSVPGALNVRSTKAGCRLELDLAWPELTAHLLVTPREGELRVDMELRGRGPEVREMARDARVL